jgi:methionyl aminopeptidase
MDPAHLEKWRRAAAIAAHVRDYVASLLVPGAKLIDASLAGHRRIAELGAEPAFPLQISRNHIAAHYCSFIGDPTTAEEGDLIKVDCGVHVDGFVADTARTVDLSRDGRHERLIDASREALAAAIAIAGPGVDVVEIGRAVETAIRRHGVEPVRNLTGHGVGRWIIHRAPQIPNVPSGRGTLKADTCVAIEPFASSGQGLVREQGDAHVFMAKRGLKQVKGGDPAVLAAIEAFSGLPFGSRCLVQRFAYENVARTLNGLASSNQIVVYPPLVDRPGSFVAQFEHTLYVSENGVEVLTQASDTPLAAPVEPSLPAAKV